MHEALHSTLSSRNQSRILLGFVGWGEFYLVFHIQVKQGKSRCRNASPKRSWTHKSDYAIEHPKAGGDNAYHIYIIIQTKLKKRIVTWLRPFKVHEKFPQHLPGGSRADPVNVLEPWIPADRRLMTVVAALMFRCQGGFSILTKGDEPTNWSRRYWGKLDDQEGDFKEISTRGTSASSIVFHDSKLLDEDSSDVADVRTNQDNRASEKKRMID